MIVRYFLEIVENGDRIPVGDRFGYKSLAEAQAEALKKTDDALPHNHVRIMLCVGYAEIGGDGEPYLQMEDKK